MEIEDNGCAGIGFCAVGSGAVEGVICAVIDDEEFISGGELVADEAVCGGGGDALGLGGVSIDIVDEEAEVWYEEGGGKVRAADEKLEGVVDTAGSGGVREKEEADVVVWLVGGGAPEARKVPIEGTCA